ncbi:MAG TPA: hypothetical protein VFH17_08490 [Coriobacteriia bacterium]|nr:hypothetical protein [Coriobacteriia bacterium]
MPRNDKIRLVLGTRDVVGWTGASVEMAIDQVADACAFTFPLDLRLSNLRDVFVPFEYQPLKVYIDDEILLTGRAEKLAPKTDAGETTLELQGRALPGSLVDCAVVGALEFTGLAFSTICKQVCRPFGVDVRADNDTDPIDLARASYGQRAADFLLDLARPRNLFLNSSYDGKLVISWGHDLVRRPVVASLVEGEHPLLSVAASFDGTGRFSRYIAATQFAGESSIASEVADPGVPIYRPQALAVKDVSTKAVEGGAVEPDACLAARQAMVAAIAGSVQVSATVSGWSRPDGERWAERQMVTLRAPGAMLPVERKWLIAGASFRLEAGSQTVDLRLVMPETYAGQAPEVLPW